MNNKQIEAIKLRRDIILELTDYVLFSNDFTEQQKTEMLEYKDYLRNISNHNYIWKQPPDFFKTSRVYNIIIECQEAMEKLKKRGLI